jgi:hypothetical protein
MQASLLLLAGLSIGCSSKAPSGPASVSETSKARARLKDRVEFIERYVTFRRTYLNLEYAVDYQNNSGGMVPGPSDWDIKLVAVVPAEEIDDWIPEGAARADHAPPKWVESVPGDIPRDKVTEWYRKGSSMAVGVHRETSTVVYRNSTNGID